MRNRDPPPDPTLASARLQAVPPVKIAMVAAMGIATAAVAIPEDGKRGVERLTLRAVQ